ncbi:hypothetical protein ACFLWJ_00955 [Chloroflexota bacterium]
MTQIKPKKIKRNIMGRRSDRVKLREHEYILRLNAQGKKLAEIARITERSASTVKRQISNVRTEKATPAQKRYSQMMKLITFLGQITSIPQPETQLLPVDDAHQDEIVQSILVGNGEPYKTAIYTSIHTPWWSSNYKVQIKNQLSYEQEILLNEILASSHADGLKYALELWERNTEAYRKLKMSNAEAKYLIAAYYGAQRAAKVLHKELRQTAAAI